MTLTDQMKELWLQGTEVVKWAEFTTPDKDLIWKAGHPAQVKDLMSIGQLLGLPFKVVGSHRSKSVELPVGMFEADIWKEEKVYFLTRDNFHDLKLVVVSSCPIHIDYDLVHRPFSRHEHDDEKRRAFDYCQKRALDDSQPNDGFDTSKFETDEWFDDWSRGSLLYVKEDEIYYRCGTTHSVYYEGINKVMPSAAFRRYEHGRDSFAVEIPGSISALMGAIEAITNSARDFVRKRRRHLEELMTHAHYQTKLAAGEELNDYHKGRLTEVEERLQAWKEKEK